ncbi:MAG TPA: PDZ domain-containing protein, partial [Bacteroidales bacterium]|nr:PDZ domain-containing protein [Bacteroidales bacterium]
MNIFLIKIKKIINHSQNFIHKVIIIISLLFLLPYGIYAQTITTNNESSDFEITKNLDIFITLFKELNQNYVDEIRPGELIETSIEALLEKLDPYTNFIPEAEIEDYEMMTTGQYGGIGAIIQKRDNYVIIAEPYENSPAHKANLMAGDKIIEVNGKSVKDKSVEEVSTILKGQPGTIVTVSIEREGEKKPLEINIKRENIKIPNIPYSGIISNNIGYIKLNSFTQNVGEEVKTVFYKLRDSLPLKG